LKDMNTDKNEAVNDIGLFRVLEVFHKETEGGVSHYPFFARVKDEAAPAKGKKKDEEEKKQQPEDEYYQEDYDDEDDFSDDDDGKALEQTSPATRSVIMDPTSL